MREPWFECNEIVLFAGLAVLGGVRMVVRELPIAESIVDLRAFRDFNLKVLGGMSCAALLLLPLARPVAMAQSRTGQ